MILTNPISSCFTINVNDLLISSCINEYLSNIPSMLFVYDTLKLPEKSVKIP